MARNERGSKPADVAEVPKAVPGTLRIQIFERAYTSDRGFIEKGTVLEIPEADFQKWSNVATEVEE